MRTCARRIGVPVSADTTRPVIRPVPVLNGRPPGMPERRCLQRLGRIDEDLPLLRADGGDATA